MDQAVAQQEQLKSDNIAFAWSLRCGSRDVGTIGSLICVVLGLFTCITFSPLCMIAGIYQTVAGCLLVKKIQHLSQWCDSKPKWQKCAFYLILSLLPSIICIALSTLIGSVFIFLTAVRYETMSSRKRTSREEVLQQASTSQMTLVETKVNFQQANPILPP